MKIVIDASVAVKLVAPEAGQEAAFTLIRSFDRRLAPQLLLLEVANTLWKKVSLARWPSPSVWLGWMWSKMQ